MSPMSLESYAMRDEATQGRRHPEQAHPYRSEYQRDRDRVIHSRAFRRLEKKTQVFAPDYSDHFRNRLTHTLEVTQISRTIGQALGLNVDLCEVLALSHDIGHPPFSHEGEKALNAMMSELGKGFDHNLHALRIVEHFEEKYPAFRGLNLTFEVREGVIKHSRDFAEPEEAYVDIREYRIGQRPPLEGQLIDKTDEIAYNSADLDDGFDSGLLSAPQMIDEVPLFRKHWTVVVRQFPGVSENLLVREVIRRLIDDLATDLVVNTRRDLVRLGIRTLEEVRDYPGRLMSFGHDMEVHNQEIKSFLRENLYDHDILMEARLGVQNLIKELFTHYVSDSNSLPPKHRDRIPDLGLATVVCDYIAGMTDSFARATFRQIFGANHSS
jgi:dGTPase